MIRNATPDDASAICEIYNHYVTDSIVTFDEVPVSESDMRGRIATSSADLPWLVCERNGVVGFAMARPWKEKPAYRHTVETSIYLAPHAVGKGLGHPLYEALLDRVREAGHRAAVAGIALPNDASIALHVKVGFRKVGQLEEVGHKLGRWIDVGYWQRLF